MGQEIEVNQGEVYIHFKEPIQGKVSFADLGISDEQLVVDGGFLRMVFDFEGIGAYNYYSVPTLELSYSENCAETHWQCEFNETTILDKYDHHGNSTVLLLDRVKLESLEHHHSNKLIETGREHV